MAHNIIKLKSHQPAADPKPNWLFWYLNKFVDTLATSAEVIHISYPPFTGPCFATYNSKIITNGSPDTWIKTLFATWCLDDWSDTAIRKIQSTVEFRFKA